MEFLSAAILGIIQGLAEFLPISSSAHLILVPWFLGWKPEGIIFDVSLHLGTALAILAFFWNDWIRLAREAIVGILTGAPLGNHDRRLAWYIVVGSIPAAIVGIALENTVEAKLRSPLITVFTLAILGLVLFYAEKRSKQDRTIEKFTWADSIWIGLSQALALVPGVSRSGITITTAMFRNSDRESAARFSFLLSTPVIVGAGVLESWKLVKAIRHPVGGIVEVHWLVLIIGVLAAALTGFLCIRFFLRYIQKKSFTPFVVYRIILAGVVLFYYLKIY
jgi:undecaprenyl-diphosphatase